MANSTKSTKRTNSKENQQTDVAPEVGQDVEVSGAWTVVEEIAVEEAVNEKDMKTSSEKSKVVQINNVDVEDADVSNSRMLYRHPSDKVIGGVCSGLADSLGWDANLVRVLWVGATLATFGGAIAAYIAFALLLPTGTAKRGVVTPATISVNQNNSNVLAYVLMGIGAFILLSNIGILGGLVGGLWSVLSIAFFPAVMIGLGYLLLNRTARTDWRKSVSDVKTSMNTRFQNTRFQNTNFTKTRFQDKVNSESVRNSFGRARSSLPLRRSVSDRMLMGVCGGLSQKLGIDANLFRFGWVILAFLTGFFPGVVAYILLGVLLPEEGVMNTTRKADSQKARQEVRDVQIL